MGACGVTGMNNMTGNLEYVSPIFHTHSHGTASMTIGQVDCGQSSGISQADNYNATYNYRCCR
jgi:hypothetical protein